LLLLLGWVLNRIARPDEGEGTPDRPQRKPAAGRAREATA